MAIEIGSGLFSTADLIQNPLTRRRVQEVMGRHLADGSLVPFDALLPAGVDSEPGEEKMKVRYVVGIRLKQGGGQMVHNLLNFDADQLAQPWQQSVAKGLMGKGEFSWVNVLPPTLYEDAAISCSCIIAEDAVARLVYAMKRRGMAEAIPGMQFSVIVKTGLAHPVGALIITLTNVQQTAQTAVRIPSHSVSYGQASIERAAASAAQRVQQSVVLELEEQRLFDAGHASTLHACSIAQM